jgi:hypothetical protein
MVGWRRRLPASRRHLGASGTACRYAVEIVGMRRGMGDFEGLRHGFPSLHFPPVESLVIRFSGKGLRVILFNAISPERGWARCSVAALTCRSQAGSRARQERRVFCCCFSSNNLCLKLLENKQVLRQAHVNMTNESFFFFFLLSL